MSTKQWSGTFLEHYLAFKNDYITGEALRKLEQSVSKSNPNARNVADLKEKKIE